MRAESFELWMGNCLKICKNKVKGSAVRCCPFFLCEAIVAKFATVLNRNEYIDNGAQTNVLVCEKNI